MSTVTTKYERDEAADAPDWRARAALLSVQLGAAAWLVRAGLGTGDIIGIPWGEQWGRLFVTAQVGRWLHGTPIGWADLLSAPTGRPFWPVDPLVQAIQLPASALGGESTGWALTLGFLSLVAGLGGTALARRAGADPWRAGVVGLLVQLNPFWLRQGAEGVTEALAVGWLFLAAAAGWRALHGPSRATVGLFALAWAAVCWTSPYHAMYGFGAALLTLPLWDRDRWRTGGVLAGVALGVGLFAAAPLVLTESGDRGRLTAAWHGGYRLVPDQLVKIRRDEGRMILVPTRPPPFGVGGDQGRRDVPALSRFFIPWPGGFPVAVLLAIGLSRPRTRRAAAFAAVFFLLGPAWGPVVRAIGLPELPSPLEALLSRLPVTNLLGNVNRSVAVPLIVAAGIAGTDKNRLGTLALGLGVAAAAWIELPGLSLPATPARPPMALFRAIEGPTAVFPSGDPPVWNPGPWPKENLWLAGHHGGPQGYDYGRGGEPADATLQVRLSEIAGVPVGRGAAEHHQVPDDRILADLRAQGFTRILVVRRTLDDAAWEQAYAWLTEKTGPPLAMDQHGGVWPLSGR